MFGLSGWEIPLIVLLALLFFGGTKLPELARGVGKSIRTFKDEVTKEEEEGYEQEDETAKAEEVKQKPKKKSTQKSSSKKPSTKKKSS